MSRLVWLVAALCLAWTNGATAQSWILEGVQVALGPPDLRFARGLSLTAGANVFVQTELLRESANRRRNFCAGLIVPGVNDCPPDATHVSAWFWQTAIGYANGKPGWRGGVRVGAGLLNATWTRDQRVMRDERRWYVTLGGHVSSARTLRPSLRLRAAGHVDLQIATNTIDCSDCYTAYFAPLLIPTLRLGLEYLTPAGSK